MTGPSRKEDRVHVSTHAGGCGTAFPLVQSDVRRAGRCRFSFAWRGEEVGRGRRRAGGESLFRICRGHESRQDKRVRGKAPEGRCTPCVFEGGEGGRGTRVFEVGKSIGLSWDRGWERRWCEIWTRELRQKNTNKAGLEVQASVHECKWPLSAFGGTSPFICPASRGVHVYGALRRPILC